MVKKQCYQATKNFHLPKARRAEMGGQAFWSRAPVWAHGRAFWCKGARLGIRVGILVPGRTFGHMGEHFGDWAPI